MTFFSNVQPRRIVREAVERLAWECDCREWPNLSEKVKRPPTLKRCGRCGAPRPS